MARIQQQDRLDGIYRTIEENPGELFRPPALIIRADMSPRDTDW